MGYVRAGVIISQVWLGYPAEISVWIVVGCKLFLFWMNSFKPSRGGWGGRWQNFALTKLVQQSIKINLANNIEIIKTGFLANGICKYMLLFCQATQECILCTPVNFVYFMSTLNVQCRTWFFNSLQANSISCVNVAYLKGVAYVSLWASYL